MKSVGVLTKVFASTGVIFLFLAVAPGIAIAGDSGLNARPANPSCVAPDRPVTTLNMTYQRVFAGLSLAGVSPSSMSQQPGDPSRWLVSGREGEIYSFANNNAVTTKQLVLDITDRMQFTSTDQFEDSQQYGVMSFALHPQFATNPYMYVAYNAKQGSEGPVRSVVSRFTSNNGGATFDSLSEQEIITVEQQTVFHHVGQIVFGLDGYLYIGLGDGGITVSSQAAQNLNDLRGSVLRIDVDQGLPYAIPSDNPLVGTGFREEIYAYGFRNPWRFTFDRDTGELWLADVGAESREEINLIDAGGNYGWPVLEGTICNNATQCESIDHEPPLLEIEHPDAIGIIGGYVYRGSDLPSLQGTFLFGDSVVSEVRALLYDLQGAPFWDVASGAPHSISSFAEALDGEVFFIRVNVGAIYKLVPTGTPPPDNFPGLLSETGCVDPQNPGIPASGLIPFSVKAPLWSDGAEKDRWMALPDGETINVAPDGDFEFPIGTILMKTFSFDSMPVETRLFMRHDDGGWAGYSYEWNEELTDAELLPAGKSKQISHEITWNFPSRNQCLRCHTDAAGFSLGPEVAQLNGSFTYPSTAIKANQLNTLDHIGMFSAGLPDQVQNLPALAALSQINTAVERRAKSYLHSNCSGCHRPGGGVQSNVDLRYSTAIELMNACEALPEAGDLGNPDTRILKPGFPSESIISMRMHSLGIYRMPLLGSAIVDVQGTAAIDEWISQTDVCDVYADTDSDLVRDNVDNCPTMQNANQADVDSDGVGDACDNCIAHANSSQCDTNGDGYGNHCDADITNDGVVNTFDLSEMRDNFGAMSAGDTDLNCDNVVNSFDVSIMRQLFGGTPGPSALVP